MKIDSSRDLHDRSTRHVQLVTVFAAKFHMLMNSPKKTISTMRFTFQTTAVIHEAHTHIKPLILWKETLSRWTFILLTDLLLQWDLWWCWKSLQCHQVCPFPIAVHYQASLVALVYVGNVGPLCVVVSHPEQLMWFIHNSHFGSFILLTAFFFHTSRSENSFLWVE